MIMPPTLRSNRAPSLRLSAAFMLACAAFAGAAPVVGDFATVSTLPPRYVLLSGTLARTAVREIVSISPDGINILDGAGNAVSVPMSGVLAVVPAGWFARTTSRGVGIEPSDEAGIAPIMRAGGMLELTDGQRLTGNLPGLPSGVISPGAPELQAEPAKPMLRSGPAGSGPAGSGPAGSGPFNPPPLSNQPAGEVAEALTWQHPDLGTVSVKLERIRRWTIAGHPTGTIGVPDQDVVLFANGDRALGFFAGLASEGGSGFMLSRGQLPLLRFEPVGGQPIVVSAASVSSVSLSGQPIAPRGKRMLLADGTDVLCAELLASRSTGISATLQLAEGRLSNPVSLEQLVGILPDVSRWVDLTRTFAHSRGNVVAARHLDRSEPADGIAGSILMPAWGQVILKLPADAERVSMLLVVPEPCRLLANCQVRVELGGKVIAAAKLSAGQPTAELDVKIVPATGDAARELTITLADGDAADGPVQDQVLIRRPIAIMPAAKR